MQEIILRKKSDVSGWKTLNFYWFKIFPVGFRKITRWDVVKNKQFYYAKSFLEAFKIGVFK
jgi:hypothetical protein